MEGIEMIVRRIPKVARDASRRNTELIEIARDVGCWILEQLKEAGLRESVDLGAGCFAEFRHEEGDIPGYHLLLVERFVAMVMWRNEEEVHRYSQKPLPEVALLFANQVRQVLRKLDEVLALHRDRLMDAANTLQEAIA